jgi:cell division cycle protein 20 (cofactor of APC complex)
VSVRPKTFLPLNITPRTRRISKQFGLVDDKVLNFNDDVQIASSSSSRDENAMVLIRRSASSLFHKPPVVRAMSVTENLSKQKDCRAILDSPGVPKDPDAYPMSWSRRNLIAVVCLFDIFYQDLNTKSVSQLCRSTHSATNVIQWGGDGVENYLASGNNSGSVLIWDAGTPGGRGQVLCNWRGTPFNSIKSLAWNQNVLATGAASGELSLIDTRVANTISTVRLHTSPLVGLQWSSDGTFLASGDKSGTVQIWDRRVGKSLLDGANTKKIRHRGSAKALSWCPWKHDLLATGTTAPEGKIRIWNTSSITSPVPTPERTIPLNTSVTSLHWSPHCKEILSTHGWSFTPVLQSRSQNSANAAKLSHTKTPLVNSIAVHQYPSCKRLMTLTDAHSSVVTHSCLSPEGESIFTVCPREETIKMWKVWSAPKPVGKRECAFDKYAIR